MSESPRSTTRQRKSPSRVTKVTTLRIGLPYRGSEAKLLPMRWNPSIPSSAVAMAGWIAWAAVGLELWSGPVVATATGAAIPVGLVVRGLHVLFAIIFAWSLARNLHRTVKGVLAVALVAITLCMVALYRYNSAAALLIIPMLAFAGQLGVRMLAFAYVATNLLLLSVVLAHRQMDAPFTYVGLHASLQLFAVLLMRSMLQTERANAAVTQAHAELLATRGMLSEIARGQERLRLSRELHDVAGHKLTALRLNLGALTHNPQLDATQVIALCTCLVEELLTDLRGVVHQLRAHDGLELGATLERIAGAFPRPRTFFDLAAGTRVQTLDQAEALLRTFQEGLTNAARHGDAQQLWVRLHRRGDEIVMDMRDDGHGQGDIVAGHGLVGMRERLHELGGDLEVSRLEGSGFCLRAWLPVCR